MCLMRESHKLELDMFKSNEKIEKDSGYVSFHYHGVLSDCEIVKNELMRAKRKIMCKLGKRKLKGEF